MPYQAVFYQPSHFHAALTLREQNNRLHESIHVYANPGSERDAFVNLVESFNQRAENPTHWQLQLHQGAELLEQLIADGQADFVVLAGRNNDKLQTIAHLTQAGLPVFADKPWLTDSQQLPYLQQALAEPVISIDIMTIRHEILARLGHQVIHSAALFGGFSDDAEHDAVINIGSVHHLYKMVNGRPLQRPPWYYDIQVQGDGIVDIQSHMIEQAQWWVLDEGLCDYERDIELLSARRSATAVPADLFHDSTGLDQYPEALQSAVENGVLQYACNGEIRYRLNGISVRQIAEWRQREPDGAGDMHSVQVYGKHCNLIVVQGPETSYRAEVHLQPLLDDFEAILQTEIAAWQQRFPGLSYQASEPGFRFVAPADLDHGHESHFPLVLEQFLDYLDAGKIPAAVSSRIRSRYTLLARARELVLSD